MRVFAAGSPRSTRFASRTSSAGVSSGCRTISPRKRASPSVSPPFFAGGSGTAASAGAIGITVPAGHRGGIRAPAERRP